MEELTEVKPLVVLLAMIDNGKLDWKVVAVSMDDEVQ
jgi:inorganic pyrophosphatase